MKWIITWSPDGINVGLSNGLRMSTPTGIQFYRLDCETEFRLLDADGEIYYKGWCKDLAEQDGDSAFEPMDAFASEGVVEMQYFEDGEWKTL